MLHPILTRQLSRTRTLTPMPDHRQTRQPRPTRTHHALRSTPGSPRSIRSNARNTPDRDIPTRAPIRANDQPFARNTTTNRSRSPAGNAYIRSPMNQ